MTLEREQVNVPLTSTPLSRTLRVASSKSGAFTLVPLDDGTEPEPIAWLVEGYVELSATTIVYGHSGTLKSFIALHWALCVITGRSFFGREVRKGKVVFVAGEGRRGLVRRIRAWEKIYGVIEAEDRASLLALSNGDDRTVTACVSDETFMRTLEEEVIRHRPLLIIFDTVATTFGLKEESNEEISRALATLRRHLVDRVGCAVVVIHHTGKDGSRGARGGYSMKCDADASFWIALLGVDGRPLDQERREPFDWKRDHVRLLPKKSKDEEPPLALTFGALRQDVGCDPRGAPITSLTLRLDDGDLSGDDRKIIKAWATNGSSERRVSEATGIPKTTVHNLLVALRAKGFCVEKSGPKCSDHPSQESGPK